MDKNDSGTIDNGTELFGPQNNHSFLELKVYDQDQNDWIDEKDTVHSQLRIWSKDNQGNDILSSLKEYNVGAIYLNNSLTPFNLEDGKIKEIWIYLKENTGKPGYIQEIDLTT